MVLIQCASNMNTSILIRDTLKVKFTLAVCGRYDALRRRFVGVKWAFPRDAGGIVYYQRISGQNVFHFFETHCKTSRPRKLVKVRICKN